jgi:hypothetical protein
MRITKFGSDFDNAYGYIREHSDGDVDPKELAQELAAMSKDERDEFMELISDGDYEEFAAWCHEHNIQYH